MLLTNNFVYFCYIQSLPLQVPYFDCTEADNQRLPCQLERCVFVVSATKTVWCICRFQNAVVFFALCMLWVTSSTGVGSRKHVLQSQHEVIFFQIVGPVIFFRSSYLPQACHALGHYLTSYNVDACKEEIPSLLLSTIVWQNHSFSWLFIMSFLLSMLIMSLCTE